MQHGNLSSPGQLRCEVIHAINTSSDYYIQLYTLLQIIRSREASGEARSGAQPRILDFNYTTISNA